MCDKTNAVESRLPKREGHTAFRTLSSATHEHSVTIQQGLVLKVYRHLGWESRRHFETRQPFPSVWGRRQGSKLCNQPRPRGLQRTEEWKLVQAGEGLALTQLSLLSQTKAGIPVLPGRVGRCPKSDKHVQRLRES